jgi:hypothetical protein
MLVRVKSKSPRQNAHKARLRKIKAADLVKRKTLVKLLTVKASLLMICLTT